jgi:hypothetical protein
VLAMDVNDDAGFLEKRGGHASIASKLAPTVVPCRTQKMCSLKINCGSEPARGMRSYHPGDPTHPPSSSDWYYAVVVSCL